MTAPSRLPSAKPAITSAKVTPVWNMRWLTFHMRTPSAAMVESGGTMKGGMPSSPGPHSPAARKTTSSATLAAAPRRSIDRWLPASIVPLCGRLDGGGFADIQAMHQHRRVLTDARVLTARDRIIAVRHVDHDLVDDAARPRAHHQHAVRHQHRL